MNPFRIAVLLILILHVYGSIEYPKSCNMGSYLDETHQCSELESEVKFVREGSKYIDTECSVYVIPYINLTAIPCPLIISRMSASDSNCYRVYYKNDSIRTLNIKMSLPPTSIELGRKVDVEPFNGDVFTLICPLYGAPELEYTWSVPFQDRQYPGIDMKKLNYLIVTKDAENNGSILPALNLFKFKDNCPTGLFVSYYDYRHIDGDYYCTGKNEFGSKTVLVATVNNGGTCLSPHNKAFHMAGELIVELQREYKVTTSELGGDVNLTCKIVPFASNVRVGWLKDGDEVNIIASLCEDDGGLQMLSTDSKYTVIDQREKCTKVSSLIIHNFGKSDLTKYTCIAQLCSKDATHTTMKLIEVNSDTHVVLKTDWVFSFTALPVVTAIICSITLTIAIYVNKVRLIRWYIAWKREEPSGHFEYDAFICISEEYDAELIEQVRDEILYQMMGNARILWQENDDCQLIGQNHYVNALEIMNKCKKFVFIVNESFGHCFFCKQMVELVTEKSRAKNWNIILPVKWTDKTVVPKELMVYRYVERGAGGDYLGQIDNFIKGRPVVNRYRRSTVNYQALFSKTLSSSYVQVSTPLINP